MLRPTLTYGMVLYTLYLIKITSTVCKKIETVTYSRRELNILLLTFSNRNRKELVIRRPRFDRFSKHCNPQKGRSRLPNV